MRGRVEILLKKANGSLWAADPMSDEYVTQLTENKDVLCIVWAPRNPKFHRYAMSYLHTVLQNNDRFDDFDDLMTWLKIKCGLFTMFAGVSGETYRLQESISFSAMDEVHFRRFMNRAQYWISEELIPGFDLKAFDAEAARLASSYESYERG